MDDNYKSCIKLRLHSREREQYCNSEDVHKFRDILFEVPTQEDKKKVLETIENPNFEKYFYCFRENISMEVLPYLKSDIHLFTFKKDIGNFHALYANKNWQIIYGSKKKPYYLFHKKDHNKGFPGQGILPYVCYQDNGDIILTAVNFVINQLPQDMAEESVVVVYQWKYNNPTKEGFDVIGKTVMVKNLIKKIIPYEDL